MSAVKRWGATLGLLCVCAQAQADPVTVRMATIAPEGTAWDRVIKQTTDELKTTSSGRIQLKWYMNAIAGDEQEVVERIKRGQVDGAAFTLVCDRLAPSLKALRPVVDRAEHDFLLQKMRPRIDEELEHNGLVAMGLATLGTTVLFTRHKVTTLEELKHARLWAWINDDYVLSIAKRMGLTVVPTSIEDARAASDSGKVDGYITIPSGMIAYQWWTRMKFFAPGVRFGSPSGCVVVTKKLHEKLAAPDRELLRDRLEKLAEKIGTLMRDQDARLLGDVFLQRGLTSTPTSDTLKAADAAVQKAGGEAASDLVTPQIMSEVRSYSEQFRARK
jgi:TRAP-type C4-dicarboxylate transport system substrate-binding protein